MGSMRNLRDFNLCPLGGARLRGVGRMGVGVMGRARLGAGLARPIPVLG